MKTRQIPAILMLIAGLITCIVSFLGQVGMVQFLIRLCIVLAIFFVLGEIIRYLIDRSFPKEEETTATQDGETEQEEQEEDNKDKKE